MRVLPPLCRWTSAILFDRILLSTVNRTVPGHISCKEDTQTRLTKWLEDSERVLEEGGGSVSARFANLMG